MDALDTGLGDDGGGLHVLGGEGVGGPGGQHQVVGLDLPCPETSTVVPRTLSAVP